MGAEKKKKYGEMLSRRGRERFRQSLRSFDRLCGALALVIVVATISCYGRPYELGASHPAGFAYWFLLFLAYLPLELLGMFNWLFGMQESGIVQLLVEKHQALGMGVCDLVLLLAVWIAARFWGANRFGVNFLDAVGRFVAVFMVWGVFQLLCMAAVVVWSNGGFRPLHRHLNRPDEPERVIIVNPSSADAAPPFSSPPSVSSPAEAFPAAGGR